MKAEIPLLTVSCNPTIYKSQSSLMHSWMLADQQGQRVQIRTTLVVNYTSVDLCLYRCDCFCKDYNCKLDLSAQLPEDSEYEFYDNVAAVLCDSSNSYSPSNDTDGAKEYDFWYFHSSPTIRSLSLDKKECGTRSRLGIYQLPDPIVVNPRRLEWIIFPGDPLIYSGSTLSKCLAVEDINDATGFPVGHKDPSRLNVYLASCNSSSVWQQWTIDNSTGFIRLASKPDFSLGKSRLHMSATCCRKSHDLPAAADLSGPANSMGVL
jgi:hypothetical protein